MRAMLSPDGAIAAALFPRSSHDIRSALLPACPLSGQSARTSSRYWLGVQWWRRRPGAQLGGKPAHDVAIEPVRPMRSRAAYPRHREQHATMSHSSTGSGESQQACRPCHQEGAESPEPAPAVSSPLAGSGVCAPLSAAIVGPGSARSLSPDASVSSDAPFLLPVNVIVDGDSH
jgi:hypothetical protein